MNEIKTFAVKKEKDGVGLFRFDEYQGRYTLLGSFSRFIERENIALFFPETTAEITIVFQDEDRIFRGIEGKFVGVLGNKVMFENENKELMSVDSQRNIVQESEPRNVKYKFWKGKDKAFYVINSLSSCPVQNCSLEAEGWINLKSQAGFHSSHKLQEV